MSPPYRNGNDAAEQRLAGDQRADAERRQHLVEREHQIVGTERAEVDEAAGHELRAVDQQQRAPFAARLPVVARIGQLADRVDRILRAEKVGRSGAAHELGRGSRSATSDAPGRAHRSAASKRASRSSTRRPNRGRMSWHIACHGTKFELCSMQVETTLSPSRNSLSNEYITVLIASVALRTTTTLLRLGGADEAGDVVVGRFEAPGRAAAMRSTGRGARSRIAARACRRGPAARAAAACSRRCWWRCGRPLETGNDCGRRRRPVGPARHGPAAPSPWRSWPIRWSTRGAARGSMRARPPSRPTLTGKSSRCNTSTGPRSASTP